MGRVPISERMKWYLLERVPMLSRDIDEYLTLYLPDLIETHDLATHKDIGDLENRFKSIEERINELEMWQKSTEDRLKELDDRIAILEKKYNLR